MGLGAAGPVTARRCTLPALAPRQRPAKPTTVLTHPKPATIRWSD